MGRVGRGLNAGEGHALHGADAGDPVGVLNSALSSHGSPLAKGVKPKVGIDSADFRRSRSEGGTGVMIWVVE